MKHLPLIALALLLSFPASSFAYDNYKVLGNYKELRVIVEEVRENSVGVTEEDLERTLKLRLMRNGIKPITDSASKHYLYFRLTILDVIGGFAASVDINLRKLSGFYLSPAHGVSFDHIPSTFQSGGLSSVITGSEKSQVLGIVEKYIDKFILAYLEANME